MESQVNIFKFIHARTHIYIYIYKYINIYIHIKDPITGVAMVVVLFLMYADTNQNSPLYNSILNTELQSKSNPLHYEDVVLEQKITLNGKDCEGSPAEKMVLIVASIVAIHIQKFILSREVLDDQ